MKIRYLVRAYRLVKTQADFVIEVGPDENPLDKAYAALASGRLHWEHAGFVDEWVTDIVEE